jgi:hypothetical protein
MSQRQSCNRCRQQKVRCLRDEAPRGESNLSSSGRPSLVRCERCTKAGVECVYSRMHCVAPIYDPHALRFSYYVLRGGKNERNQVSADRGLAVTTIAKQRSNRRHVPTSIRRDIDPDPDPDPGPGNGNGNGNMNLNGTLWFEQGLAEALYSGGPSLPSLGANYADLVGQFPGLDESGTVAVGSFHGWDAASSAADAVAPTSTAPSIATTTDGREDGDDCTQIP